MEPRGIFAAGRWGLLRWVHWLSDAIEQRTPTRRTQPVWHRGRVENTAKSAAFSLGMAVFGAPTSRPSTHRNAFLNATVLEIPLLEAEAPSRSPVPGSSPARNIDEASLRQEQRQARPLRSSLLRSFLSKPETSMSVSLRNGTCSVRTGLAKLTAPSFVFLDVAGSSRPAWQSNCATFLELLAMESSALNIFKQQHGNRDCRASIDAK